MIAVAFETFTKGFLRWRGGRQESGYEKLLLGINPFIVPWDCYVLRFREGAEIAPHTDPVDGRRHYRLNIILAEPKKGGEFQCENPIFESRYVKFFRPDRDSHSVTRVEDGTRYVLSIGWALT